MTDSSDLQSRYDKLRDRIVGLGEQSIRKSYYPELQHRIMELERFRLLLDQSSDLIMLLAVPSGQILECNESACRELGRSRDVLRTQTFFNLIDPASADHAIRLFSDAQKGIFRRDTFISSFTTAAVSRFPIEISMKTVSLDQSLLAVADARNITDRLRAESERKASEERYRTLFEDSRDAIYMVSAQGDFIDINQAGVDMLGYSTKDEVFQLNMEHVYAEPSTRKQALQILASEGYLKDYEVLFKKRNGEFINVLLTTSTMYDDRGAITGYRGIMRDITSHKKLEQQLLQSQKMEAIGRLTAGIAHDFNNILTTILGYATILELKLTNEGPMKQYVSNVVLSAERAAVLIKRLLSFSRQQTLSVAPVDPNVIVQSVGDLISEVIGEDITLDIVPSPQSLLINADKSQIEQALMNLVTNARDAMPEGGTLRIQCEHFFLGNDFVHQYGYGRTGEYALMSVSDTGTGMDSEVQRKLFEPFFTTKEVGKGTGLGLSIVYGIMKQHDGFVNVESAPGKGTTFRLYFPVIRPEENAASAPASPE